MGLNLMERKKLTNEVIKRYARADKKGKSAILDEFVAITNYCRKYAISILNSSFKIHSWVFNDHTFSGTKILHAERKKRTYQKKYGPDVLSALSSIWRLSHFMCGQRLVSFLRDNISYFAKELNFSKSVTEKLSVISSATIDRLLKRSRSERAGKGISTTKAGTELNKLIPIRTYFDWDERIPGFFETDTVSHDGGNASGEHCYTVDVTDVCTGWTELRAVKNKAQKWVVDAINDAKNHIPYPMKGLDSDNGSEFKNYQLLDWCNKNQIQFTRIRPYKKNDNCFVEQKNNALIRKIVGYYRYEGDENTLLMNTIYKDWCLLVNYFHPSIRIIAKEKKEARVYKKYDSAKTPYMRILENESVSEIYKEKLKKEKEKLDYLKIEKRLQKNIERLLENINAVEKQN